MIGLFLGRYQFPSLPVDESDSILVHPLYFYFESDAQGVPLSRLIAFPNDSDALTGAVEKGDDIQPYTHVEKSSILLYELREHIYILIELLLTDRVSKVRVCTQGEKC
jgi:hypothetical protein